MVIFWWLVEKSVVVILRNKLMSSVDELLDNSLDNSTGYIYLKPYQTPVNDSLVYLYDLDNPQPNAHCEQLLVVSSADFTAAKCGLSRRPDPPVRRNSACPLHSVRLSRNRGIGETVERMMLIKPVVCLNLGAEVRGSA